MRGRVLVVLALLLLAAGLPASSRAESFAHPAFQALWAATDQPVAAGAVRRAWLWGPEPFTTGRQESYAEASGGQRLVQYFDKGRMELTTPGGPVTSGLLARELATGLVQTGDQRHEQRSPAAVGLAGDPGEPETPTYATFGRLINRPPVSENAAITEVVNRDGGIGADGVLARYGVRADDLIPETGHRLASVFRLYFSGMPLPNSEGETREAAPFTPWYATVGLPITDAYWTRVRVSGITRDVLVQVFERRVLTYTPSNPAGSRVEMGNVGRHYLAWLEGPASPVVAGLPCPIASEPPLVDGDDPLPFAVLNSALHEVGERRFLSGAIRNDGPSSPSIEVVVNRLTSDGRRLGRSSGFTDRDFWPNGQVAGFQIDLPPNEPMAAWRIETRRAITRPTGGLAGGFSLEELTGRVDEFGAARATGLLRYTGTVRHDDLVVVRLHGLDACGSLVATGFATLGGASGLAPGSVTPFSSALMLRAEGAVQLRAVIEARVGTASAVADDALRVYSGGLFPTPILPIIGVDGCCRYLRAYERPDGTPVRSHYRLPGG